MNVVITGKGGQLAWELEQIAPQSFDVVSVGKNKLDITDEVSVNEFINSTKPDLVINAAAYTAVDKAESNVDAAYATNELGVKYLANACKRINARILHVSTDFVFDGTSTMPYQTNSITNPLNVYGASKLAGELALQEILPQSSVIVRTAWVYSVNGNNFVKNMLSLMQERSQLGVVCDQVGSPTWARSLACWLWAVAINEEVTGVYHWTDAGIASWYDFAIAIQELGIEKGLLNDAIPIFPIATSDYPLQAKRPAFSVVDKSSAEKVVNFKTRYWRKQLSDMMNEL